MDEDDFNFNDFMNQADNGYPDMDMFEDVLEDDAPIDYDDY